MTPGRAQHPTPEMLDHSRDVTHMQSLRDMIARLGHEINDRMQMRAEAKKTLRRLQQDARRRVA